MPNIHGIIKEFLAKQNIIHAKMQRNEIPDKQEMLEYIDICEKLKEYGLNPTELYSKFNNSSNASQREDITDIRQQGNINSFIEDYLSKSPSKQIHWMMPKKVGSDTAFSIKSELVAEHGDSVDHTVEIVSCRRRDGYRAFYSGIGLIIQAD